MRRMLILFTGALVMAAMLASGVSTTMAGPKVADPKEMPSSMYGPNPYPGGCVGSAVAPAANQTPEDSNGLHYLNSDPSSSPDQDFVTAGDYIQDHATGQCQASATASATAPATAAQPQP